MSYLQGGYLSGDAGITDSDALDKALSAATSDKQLANFKFYYGQVASLTPAARDNLIASLNNVLARLPPKVHDLVVQMGNRTASYADPRGVPGLGQVAAAAGAANTVSTIAAITGIIATLGTIGLQVATTLDQRKQNNAAAHNAQETENIQQQILRSQLAEQELRIADLKAQSTAKAGAGPGIAPDGSLILPAAPKTTTPAAVATGIALTGAAAYMLTR